MQSEKFDIFSDAEEKNAHALNLYIVSDFTAETASSLVRAAIRQFNSGLISLRRFRYVDTLEKIDEVCRKAREEEAIIVCTLVRRSMRVALRERAQTLGIVAVELFGPLLEGILSDRVFPGHDFYETCAYGVAIIAMQEAVQGMLTVEQG